MSALHEALYAHLAADSAVSALVGTRIGFGNADEDDSLPYIVMQEISGTPETHLTADTGKQRTRMQINSYGRDKDAASAVAIAVRDAIHTLKGTLGDGAVTVDCRFCQMAGQRDEVIDPPSGDRAGSDQGIFGIQQDYVMVHAVSIPVFS